MQNEQKDWYSTRPARPVIVCLCGSTRFKAEFDEANAEQTLAGKIVLQPGHYTHTVAIERNARTRPYGGKPVSGDKEYFFTPEVAQQLELLYLRKIELADEILVINPGGYIGDSTRKELAHAAELGKRIYYLEKPFRAADDHSSETDLAAEHGTH